MAGGKETPRQKMIGMMYLVLTALLALNVSKQILDAFVAIEENIQRGSESQLIRAAGDIESIQKALAEAEIEAKKTGEAENETTKEIKQYLGIVESIDKDAGEIIRMIDEAKLHILKLAGEPVDNVADKDPKAIVWVPYSEEDPVRPAKLNLMAINAKDNFDVPMHELVGSDVKSINESALGMPIWIKFKEYRSKLVEKLGTYEKSGDKFVVKTTMIDDFEDYNDLRGKVRSMLFADGNNVRPQDTSMLKDIYMSLTKKEMDLHHELEGVHWLGRTFDHAPMVGALASLSTLQYEVLSARAKATSLLASRCSSGKYAFDVVQGMAFVNTGVVDPGGEFELTLFAGAYNSTKQPTIKMEDQSWTGEKVADSNGRVVYKVKGAGSGDMVLTGKIGITAGGRYEEFPYETKITVAKGEGAVEMPEFNILYVGYNNFMVASGCIDASIQASGCSVSRTSKKGRSGFAVRPSAKGPVSVRISGKDPQGKPVSFGPFPYTAKSFPVAVFKTKSINKATGGVVEAKMPDSSPINATFSVIRGTVLGIDNGGFAGGRIPADKLKTFRKGNKIGVSLTVKNNLTGLLQDIDGSLKLK